MKTKAFFDTFRDVLAKNRKRIKKMEKEGKLDSDHYKRIKKEIKKLEELLDAD